MLLSNKDPFSRGMWEDFLAQSIWLQEYGLSVNDVTAALLASQEQPLRLRQCPSCQWPMQLLPVNDSPSTQTEDDSKSLWLCPHCFYEEFSTKDVKEELAYIKEN